MFLLRRINNIHSLVLVYQCMLEINDFGDKITISGIAKLLNCSTRTIHRNMGIELKREKELLNKQL